MLDYPFNYHYGQRLENIDYEDMGAKDIWFIRNTVILLTSYEMELKKYLDRPDHEEVYSKLFSRFNSFIHDCIMNKAIPFNDGLTDKARDLNKAEGITVAFDLETTFFHKDDILNYIEDSAKIFVNIDTLEDYLYSGRGPVRTFEKSRCDTIAATDTEMQSSASGIADSTLSSDKLSANESQYLFKKTTQSWNLRFGDVYLEGVKNLVGMDYIQILLKTPGVPIGVYQIQAMSNPEGIKAPEGKRKQEFEIFEGHAAATSTHNNSYKNNDTKSSKATSLENLKKRLEVLLRERNELDSDCDHIELEVIDNEYAKIEAAIDEIKYSKSDDDPQLKNNRDKVSKNIKLALKNIRALEVKKGHKSTPLYNFLKNQIKAVSVCVYTPPIINPPQWTF